MPAAELAGSAINSTPGTCLHAGQQDAAVRRAGEAQQGRLPGQYVQGLNTCVWPGRSQVGCCPSRVQALPEAVSADRLMLLPAGCVRSSCRWHP